MAQQKYEKLASALKAKLEPAFWNNQKQAFVHNCVDGRQSDAVTRYANMFSVFFDYLNADKQQAIKQSVLLNDEYSENNNALYAFLRTGSPLCSW